MKIIILLYIAFLVKQFNVNGRYILLELSPNEGIINNGKYPLNIDISSYSSSISYYKNV